MVFKVHLQKKIQDKYRLDNDDDTNLVQVVDDIAKKCHEDKNLDTKQEVVLVGDTPDDRPLILAHPTKDPVILNF